MNIFIGNDTLFIIFIGNDTYAKRHPYYAL